MATRRRRNERALPVDRDDDLRVKDAPRTLTMVAPLAPWQNRGMARTRLSTTVDADLLADARRVRSGLTDAALVDEALQPLLARQCAAEVDVSYAAYDEHPLDEPDTGGDLTSFREAAAAS
jgi:hypothetical protein